MATIIHKYKLYGFKNFIKFSYIEINRIIARHTLKTFSQNKEDLIIENLLTYKPKSYIDIGSNHPIKFNNTYRFYLSGARGINIEPNRSLISLYNKLRPRDNNLNIGVAKKANIKIFYQLDPDVDSTFSQKQALNKINSGSYLIDKYKVNLINLQKIFNRYLKNTKIDLLTIDTEGYDYQIIQGNDWSKNRPKIICIEDNSLAIQSFLISQDYILKAITNNNSIYLDEK